MNQGFIRMNKFYYFALCAGLSLATFTGCEKDDDGEKSSSENNSYVDLGLSVKWATCNVGATKPTEFGGHFAWGETSVKDNYTRESYKWVCLDDDELFIKYCPDRFGCDNYKDSYVTLLPEDDAATSNWGDKWRIPTQSELNELVENCYGEWTTNYDNSGVAGYIIYKVKSEADKGVGFYDDSAKPSSSYSLSDTHIFMPSAGYRIDSGDNLVNGGSRGYYWTSTLDQSYSPVAFSLFFDGDEFISDDDSRYLGLSVRPVLK